jgi:steroid delta-isomerase-like uncharacterized protein
LGYLIVGSFAGLLDDPKGAHVMSAEDLKTKDRRAIEEGLNQKNLAVYDELVAADVVNHSPTGTTHGLAAYKQFLSAYFTAFPDLHFTIHAQLAEGDLSVVHWTASGSQQGPLAGIPPTGKQATNQGVGISRWVNGKVQEGWVFFDNLSLMQQLGVIPKQG